MQQDYYSVLASVIMASTPDDARLRQSIYELARKKLRQQLAWKIKERGRSEAAQQLLELESAIEQIEADLAKGVRRHAYSGVNVSSGVKRPPVEIMLPARHLRAPASSAPGYEVTAERAARSKSSVIRLVLPLVGVAILGAVTYVAIERGLREEPQSKVQVDQNIPHNSTSTLQPAIPIPGAYGVYAVTDGQLTELDPLPIKVPDQRVFGAISTASTTKLPNGRIQFIVFRRDLVKNAPEKVVVRVVAQVMHASASGKEGATTSAVSDLWAVRDTSYEMKVAPVDGIPAMILIRPAHADFSFPAGRYALVVKAVAYDFSVDGPITDLAQCVEPADGLNAPSYKQCRH